MLDTKQKIKIAGYMGLEVREGASNYVYTKKNSSAYLFNPDTDDEINYKVFKALVDECKKRGYRIELDEEFYINEFSGNIGHAVFYASEFNNESICLAYLAVMESK